MIRGTPGFRLDDVQGLDRILNIKRIHPRSYSLLCISDDVKQFKRKNVLFEYGHRSNDDVFLHLQREFIEAEKSDKKSIPKFTFAFEDKQISISYVSIMADVSIEQWLAVESDWICEIWMIAFYWIFQSPWAIIFHNKIRMTQNSFRATVYGSDKKPFSAQFTIFGTRKWWRRFLENSVVLIKEFRKIIWKPFWFGLKWFDNTKCETRYCLTLCQDS